MIASSAGQGVSGLFVPLTIRTTSRPFVPWTIRPIDLSYHRLFVPWTVRTVGTNSPWYE